MLPLMPDPLKITWRRFFRFHLSTCFVLVGILAWAMATRPYREWAIVQQSGIPVKVTHKITEKLSEGDFLVTHGGPDATGMEVFIQEGFRYNRRLRWPALALVAFLAWKGFWLCRARRREPAATQI